LLRSDRVESSPIVSADELDLEPESDDARGVRIAAFLSALLFACSDNPSVGGGRPSAELVVPAEVVVGARALIDASKSKDPDGKLLRFRYDLGDDSPAVVTGASSTHHIYRSRGRFRACVWVTDPEGLTAVACGDVTVVLPPDAGPADAGVDAARDATGEHIASDGPDKDLKPDQKLDLPKLDFKSDKPDLAKADLKLDMPKPDAAKPDVPKPDAAKPDVPKPDAAKPDSAKPDLKPDLGGCFSAEVGGTGAAGYTLKPVPACHPTLPASASKLGVNKDEVGAITILPFAFSFFGKSSFAAGVSSNGYLQLVGPSPLSLLQPVPATLPTSASPNNLVAAFWDNLAPLSPASDVWVATLGQAPKRVYLVRWQGWTFSGTPTPATLTFSVLLYEGSNVVELQYTTLDGGARASGSQAAIGIENESGTLGLQHAFKQSGAVSTGAGLRFVPK
jgi:hypothetical protein